MYPAQNLTQHPYWTSFQASLQRVIDRLVQSGQIYPTESQIIRSILPSCGPVMQGFVSTLLQRYPNGMNIPQMDAEVETSFLPNLRAMAQQRMRTMGGQQPMMGGMQPMMGAPMGGAPMYNYNMGMPNNCGFRQPAFTAAPVAPGGLTSGVALPGGGNDPVKSDVLAPDPDLLKENEPKVSNPWAPPSLTESKDYKFNAGTMVAISKYTTSDDGTATKITVVDNRIRYRDDFDAIAAYKPAFRMFGDNNKKFLTVIYKQLKVLNVGRDEFLKLATEVTEMLGASGTLPEKLKAMIAIMSRHSVGAVKEYVGLFLDELDALTNCGELVDSNHPKYIPERFNDIETVLAFITGDISDANIKKAMFGMNGYKEKFTQVVTMLLDRVLAPLPKTILTPFENGAVKDKSVLDDYSRVLPQLWTHNGSTIKDVEDLFDMYIRTTGQVNGSVSDAASSAMSQLRLALTTYDNNFTVVYLHRVASWCNYSRTTTVSYESNGNCKPHVYATGYADDDVAWFIDDLYRTLSAFKQPVIRLYPKSLYCEYEEEIVNLNYGMTTDGSIWLGSSRYWK